MQRPNLPAPAPADPLAAGDVYGALAALQATHAEWAAGAGPEAELGQAALRELVPLLGRSYLLGQPNLAGMGVGAWDLAVADPTAALGADLSTRARRMFSDGPLAALLASPDDAPSAPEDPNAPARVADLTAALDRVRTAQATLSADAPAGLRGELADLHRRLRTRIARERQHAPTAHDERPRAAPQRPLGAKPPATARWPEPLGAPPVLEPRDGARRPPPGLGRLAAQVAAAAGVSAEALLQAATRAASSPADAVARGPEQAPGAAAPSPSEVDESPVRVLSVALSGLEGPEAEKRRAVVQATLERLPAEVARRAARRRGLSGRADRVDARLDVRADEATGPQADRLAAAVAERLVAAGATEIATLHLGVHGTGVAPEGPKALLARLAADDHEGLATRLAAERRALDGALRERLTRFFGHDFREVMVFAGPMSGALARSLSAEAITHGQMIFFDPKNFRPDTARGEALMAHELAHTRQTDPGDARLKEAQALATEAAYLDWIQPGGAPLAEDMPLDLAAPGLGDSQVSALTAREGRFLDQSEGPRASVAEHEQRVLQVLRRVHDLLEEHATVEGDRLGRLAPLITFKR